jgi:hypothetical protein
MPEQILSSLWDGLNPELIASFYLVDNKGNRDPNSEKTVKAPLMDGNIDIQLNWQSPFENMSPETKMPTLFAMLQSGALQPFVDAVLQKSGAGADAQKKSAEFLKQFEGKTGITKLNSTQVFTSLPPIKIQFTALFRAWRDPVSEVEMPVSQLIQWSLPEKLEGDSTFVSRGAQSLSRNKEEVDVLLPSKTPSLIAMKYKGRTYAPLVIESIGMPISSPIDVSGKFVELSIPMTLGSLTSIDRNDFLKYSK